MSSPKGRALDVDSFCCDPISITVLRSKDSKIFKCRSDVLHQTCGLFADMLDLRNDTSAAPITLEVSSRSLRSFLNAVYTYNMADITHKFDHLDEEDFELLALCDFVEAPLIKAAIMEQVLPRTGDGLPWLAFALSSRTGDLGLAREALKLVGRMVMSHGGARESVELAWMNDMYRLQISSKYATELFRLQLSNEYREPEPSSPVYTPVQDRPTKAPRLFAQAVEPPSIAVTARDPQSFRPETPRTLASSSYSGCNHRQVDWVKLAIAFNPK